MPVFTYFFLIGATILWCMPFALVRGKNKDAVRLDRGARWGVLLEAVAYSLLWQARFWERSPQAWQYAASVLLFATACRLSWTGARALGRHLRIDAAVAGSHELIRSGPYRLVRHPIYTSMLCVLLATGTLVAPFYLLAAAVAVFLAGTGIRMRAEDRILASVFGEPFETYQREVPGLVPFWRARRRLKAGSGQDCPPHARPS